MSFNGNIENWWNDGKYYVPANWTIEQQTNHFSLKHAVKNYFSNDTLPWTWERCIVGIPEVKYCLQMIISRHVHHVREYMLTLMECVDWLRANHWTRGIVHLREHTMITRSQSRLEIRVAPMWNHFCVLKLCQDDDEFYLLDSRDGSSIKAGLVPAKEYHEEFGFVCHTFELA